MELYLDNGYLDFNFVISQGMPFNAVVSPRGTGKTYGFLKKEIEEHRKFIYMRRSQLQIDAVTTKELNPFKKLNSDMGWNIQALPISKNVYAFYHCDDEGKPCSDALGLAIALSTFANLRGFDASDCLDLIYDEFVPEPRERVLKFEATAFFNAYETINRNRELEGKPALVAMLFGNSNNLANPLFLAMGLVSKAEQMKKKEQELSVNREKGITLVMIKRSPISEAKKNTALYKLTEGSDFAAMALRNEFYNENAESIQSKPLREYKPVVRVGEVTIYAHKSRCEYYVSTHANGTPPVYGAGEVELKRFRRQYYWVWEQHLHNNIYYEDALSQILLTKYLD